MVGSVRLVGALEKDDWGAMSSICPFLGVVVS